MARAVRILPAIFGLELRELHKLGQVPAPVGSEGSDLERSNVEATHCDRGDKSLKACFWLLFQALLDLKRLSSFFPQQL